MKQIEVVVWLFWMGVVFNKLQVVIEIRTYFIEIRAYFTTSPN